MKELALFLLHFFWLCYTMKKKQTHSKSRHSQAPHLQSAVELFRSPDSILYLFKHRCFYIYMKTFARKGTKPSPDSTLEGIFKLKFFARKHQIDCVLSFALYWTKLKVFNPENWKSPMSAHGQWIWYSSSVIASVYKGQEFQSPGGQICWE